MSLAVHTADLDVVGAGFVHLDYAATAPCVRAAADAVNALLPSYGSVHRGTGPRSRASTLAYERAREVLAGFLGCRPGDQVVFTRNTTDALNLLARCLPAGTTTIVFAGEHHANLLPWPRQLRLPLPPSPEAAVTAAAEALRSVRGPVLLAVTGASNVTGEVWPVRELTEVAHAHGARVVVDAAQLAPHAAVSLAGLGADYVALSGHKLYAPFGAGVLAGRADWLDAAPPYLPGGGASAAVGDAPGDVRWQTGPARHEGGTPNLLGAVSLAAVCTALAAADRAVLHDREQQLLTRLRAGLRRVPGAVEANLFGTRSARVGIVSFAVPGRDPAAVATALADRYGIGVRAGQFCAHPLVRGLTGEAETHSSPSAPARPSRSRHGQAAAESPSLSLSGRGGGPLFPSAAELPAPTLSGLVEAQSAPSATNFPTPSPSGFGAAHPQISGTRHAETHLSANHGCWGGLVRVSFGLGTTAEDIDCLLGALTEVLACRCS